MKLLLIRIDPRPPFLFGSPLLLFRVDLPLVKFGFQMRPFLVEFLAGLLQRRRGELAFQRSFAGVPFAAEFLQHPLFLFVVFLKLLVQPLPGGFQHRQRMVQPAAFPFEFGERLPRINGTGGRQPLQQL